MARSSRLTFPSVGLALGVGLLVAECFVAVKGLVATFEGRGLWRELLPPLVVYVVAGVALDLAVQLVWPRHRKGLRLARGAPLLLGAFAAQTAFGVYPGVASSVVFTAVVWAWAVHVLWALPLAVGMAAFSLSFALPTPHAAASPQRLAQVEASSPSFVVVVLDTVRLDHTSAYGYRRDTTPNLVALARRGVRFDRAYSTSCWTLPSHASLFTGLAVDGHWAHWEHMRLREDVPTLASWLTAHGYQTAGFSGNPYVSAGTGLSRGFELFDESWRTHVARRALMSGQAWARLTRGSQDKGGAAAVAGVRRWLETRDPSRPYFLFVNLMEAHAPYQDVPLWRSFTDESLTWSQADSIGSLSHEAQWQGTRVPKSHRDTTLDLLDGATASADMYLGQILEAVGREPVIVVLSDHGDLVGEHGLWGHMTGLNEPLIRVPLVMAGPGLEEGRIVEQPVSLADIMPTLLAWAGIDSPPADGMELAPVLAGQTNDRVVRADHFRNPALQFWVPNRSRQEMRKVRARRQAAMNGSRKRVVADDGSDLGYDLLADPREKNPFPGASTGLAAEAPDPERAGRKLEPAELDPGQREALRALGYLN